MVTLAGAKLLVPGPTRAAAARGRRSLAATRAAVVRAKSASGNRGAQRLSGRLEVRGDSYIPLKRLHVAADAAPCSLIYVFMRHLGPC